MNIPVALQLYSLRDYAARDFTQTLRRVKEAGYDAVEFAGDYGGRTAAQLKRELRDIGLIPLSAHIGLRDLESGETAGFCKELELPFANCSGSTVESDERVEATRAVLLSAAAQFKQVGILLGYHNHWAELDLRDGQSILETLLRPDPSVTLYAQLDYGWVSYQGTDPVDYTKRWGQRLTPPHFKDLNRDYKQRRPGDIDAEVGQGIIDFEAILRVMRDAGTISRGIIVEQEAFQKDPFDAIAISVRNIKNWLQNL